MSLTTNDIRFIARCAKCAHHLADWALKLPKEDRLCFNCKPPKILSQLGYKATSTSDSTLGKS
jgi:hypothetical protein